MMGHRYVIEPNGFRRCTRCGARWDRHSAIDVEGHDCEADAIPREAMARPEPETPWPILVGKPCVALMGHTGLTPAVETLGLFMWPDGKTEWRRIPDSLALVAAVGHLAEETEELRKVVLTLAVRVEESGG